MYDLNVNNVAHWILNDDGNGSTDEEFLELMETIWKELTPGGKGKAKTIGEWFDIVIEEIKENNLGK